MKKDYNTGDNDHTKKNKSFFNDGTIIDKV